MDEERQEDSKLFKKMKRDPAVALGLAGLTGVVAFSLYNLTKRKQKLSLYLIHTRVAAQGTLMACMTLGVIYTFINQNWKKIFPDKKD